MYRLSFYDGLEGYTMFVTNEERDELRHIGVIGPPGVDNNEAKMWVGRFLGMWERDMVQKGAVVDQGRWGYRSRSKGDVFMFNADMWTVLAAMRDCEQTRALFLDDPVAAWEIWKASQ